MENPLTTESTETDVNTNEQAETEENQVEESQEETTTEPSYDEAWDNIDVNDEPPSFESEPATEEQPSEEATQEEVAEAASQAFMASNPVLKFKGKEIPVDSPDELINLAQKGFLLETEMANIKPKKKVLDAVDGVPLEVLQAVKDLHNGKREAFDYIRNQYGLIEESSNDDFFSYNEEEQRPTSTNYKPEVPADNPLEDYWNDFARTDVAGAAKVTEVFQQLEPSFQTEVYAPDTFPLFVQSVVTGEFESLYPIAIKEKSLNPAMSWLQAYAAAAQKGAGQVQEKVANTPPASAQPPQNDNSVRTDDKSAADRVWEDDNYFRELESKIFNS
jgi:hypothetical protein